MMVDMLLDETLFADFRVGDEGARAIVEDILDGRVKAGISPLTAYRVWRGLGMDRRAEIVLLSLLRFVEEAPLSVDAAKRAGCGRLRGRMGRGKGRMARAIMRWWRPRRWMFKRRYALATRRRLSGLGRMCWITRDRWGLAAVYLARWFWVCPIMGLLGFRSNLTETLKLHIHTCYTPMGFGRGGL